jgi:uncharacterized protein (TIGR03790 family)
MATLAELAVNSLRRRCAVVFGFAKRIANVVSAERNTTLAAVLVLLATPCLAGVGPENVIVVVNGKSTVSRTIANHYVDLRNIPSSNVIVLEDVPRGLKIGLEEFQSKILRPVLEQLNSRRIAGQARVIAYSADFPTSVNISRHTAKLTDATQKRYRGSTASINGLTFFYQFLLADSAKYLDWGANLYARGPFERHFANPYLDDARRERFESAVSQLDEGKFAEAGEKFEKLWEESPSLSPLGIRAAEARMRAGDDEAAKRLIQQAVAAGWKSSTYLEESETLAAVMDEPQMQKLLERLSDFPTVAQEPIGFAADVAWTPCGHPVANVNDGLPYMMSCMLAVIHPRGSNVQQATAVLGRASRSDQTFPNAKFWFTKTSDVRTTTRFPGLGAALMWLNNLGHDAEIIHTKIPNKTGDCVGLMLGTATTRVENQKWKFVPGAISENLTSLGAHFESASQSKLTELLHAGAAISSGAVQEPYALQFKFPLPMMYGYYASGVTAIEAFYLSVSSPHQLLIVGDPLAQPFARPPADWVGVSVRSSDGKQQLRISRRPIPTPDHRPSVRAIEVFIDGKLFRRLPSVANIEMNLPGDLSGVIELRTVLVGDDLIQPRAAHVQWVELKGTYRPPIAKLLEDGMSVRVECSDAESIDLMHHDLVVGTVSGEAGDIKIDSSRLGDGPIRLQPVAQIGGRRVSGRLVILGASE